MFQLSVSDINEVFEVLSSLDNFDIKYAPVKPNRGVKCFTYGDLQVNFGM
jgi:hypothetical protein